jgi:hypothetical protein
MMTPMTTSNTTCPCGWVFGDGGGLELVQAHAAELALRQVNNRQDAGTRMGRRAGRPARPARRISRRMVLYPTATPRGGGQAPRAPAEPVGAVRGLVDRCDLVGQLDVRGASVWTARWCATRITGTGTTPKLRGVLPRVLFRLERRLVRAANLGTRVSTRLGIQCGEGEVGVADGPVRPERRELRDGSAQTPCLRGDEGPRS